MRIGRFTITEDFLCKASDHDLKRLFLDLRSYINKGRRKKQDVKKYEIELCYVQLEISLRSEQRKKSFKQRK